MAVKGPLVIVGASHAGVQLAVRLREFGFDDPMILLGDETHYPYQRPPLSKGLLMGKGASANLALRGSDFFQANDIELILGVRVESLDPGRKRLTMGRGVTLGYGQIVLATGARARALPIPGADLNGVYSLRTLDDATNLSGAMARASRACVIGGGFIGLEVASAIAQYGAPVTVLESRERLLMRSFPRLMSSYITQLHQRNSVDVRFSCGVMSLHGSAGAVEEVVLDNGDRIPCDLVVLGIGVEPNSALAAQAGVVCNNGILTDEWGRTNLPDVYAVGDVANAKLSAYPGGPFRARLESVQAANAGAKALASALVGVPRLPSEVPWFWSDQYQTKVQMAGLVMPGDEIVLRGDMRNDRFSVFYLRDGIVAACHSVSRPADHMHSRKLIKSRCRIEPKELQDESIKLKLLV